MPSTSSSRSSGNRSVPTQRAHTDVGIRAMAASSSRWVSSAVSRSPTTAIEVVMPLYTHEHPRTGRGSANDDALLHGDGLAVRSRDLHEQGVGAACDPAPVVQP